MQVRPDSANKRARAHRLVAGLWVRLEWLLSALAAPLAVVLMRARGFEVGVRAAALCIAALAFALFELHSLQQWRLSWLGFLLGRRRGDARLQRRVELALRDLPSDYDGTMSEPAPRVRALFAEQLARRKLDPLFVRLLASAEVEVARTRDAGPFHLVELHPATAAGPASLLQALFAHELAHVAHQDPLVKRVLAGALVPSCTLLAAVSAGLMEGIGDSAAAPLGMAMALLAAATLLPWAYAVLQAVSFAMELRADREAATLCGSPAPVFDLLDCLDDGGQPYRLGSYQDARPPELVERETHRLLEELLYLLPSHPPTWERRRRMLALQRHGRQAAHFLRDALPHALWGTAPLAAALVLGVFAVRLGGPIRLLPVPHSASLPRLAPHGKPPAIQLPDPRCYGPAKAPRDPLCTDLLKRSVAAVLEPQATSREPPAAQAKKTH